MALTRGRFLGYEFDRMVILFSMVDGQKGDTVRHLNLCDG
jgi:hypothetical protein